MAISLNQTTGDLYRREARPLDGPASQIGNGGGDAGALSGDDIYAYVLANVRPEPVVAIALCRNELKRIPAWLDYHRGLGIKRFIVIDNGSTDGSADYLRAQPDVTCVSTTCSFRESNFGMDWVNAARRALPEETWTLYLDMDEYLVYRGSPQRRIEDFAASLGRANAVFGLMVDMYPRGSFLEADPGQNLMETCCYFDSDYRFRTRPQKPWVKGRGPFECLGGPRLRLMSDLEREARTNWVDYLVRAQIGRVLAATPKAWRQFVVEHYPPQPPGLDKTPLTLNRRSGAEDLPYGNSHGVHDPAFAEETVVLLHFKFTSDLRDKVDAELLRQEHFRYGAEYMMYHKLIQDRRNLDLFKPGLSERFTSSDVFDRLGFFSITRQLQG